MEQSAPELVESVEADPGAVFEAHGADSVDELVAPEPPAADHGDDAAVEGLLDGSLSPPERVRRSERSTAPSAAASVETPAEDADAPGAAMVELERAIEETPDRPEQPGEDAAADVEDEEVAAALADAEDLHEGELPETISFE